MREYDSSETFMKLVALGFLCYQNSKDFKDNWEENQDICRGCEDKFCNMDLICYPASRFPLLCVAGGFVDKPTSYAG